MAIQTFEGTWEEIKQHENHLVGHRLRVTVLEDDPETSTEQAATGPNHELLNILERSAARLKGMRETSGARTQEFLRQARDGGMFGDDSDN